MTIIKKTIIKVKLENGEIVQGKRKGIDVLYIIELDRNLLKMDMKFLAKRIDVLSLMNME
ncbi:hypothetical protein CR513_25237, partial [Mucuna pruriens]